MNGVTRFAIAAMAVGVTAASYQPTTVSVAQAVASIDYGLILRSWRLKGAKSCPNVCLIVENAFPVGLLEVTRQPFRSAIREFDGVLHPLGRILPDTTGSHSDSRDGSGSVLQFAESHVFQFVPPIELGLIARPDAAPIAINYLSEADRFGWRFPELDLLLYPHRAGTVCDVAGPLSTCAGRWGNYYPRSGFVERDSEVVAAHLQAVRAGRAANAPHLRLVPFPYPFEPRTGHYVQMLAPHRRMPIRIGANVSAVDRGASRDGSYLFAHFGIFETCRGCDPVRLMGARRP